MEPREQRSQRESKHTVTLFSSIATEEAGWAYLQSEGKRLQRPLEKSLQISTVSWFLLPGLRSAAFSEGMVLTAGESRSSDLEVVGVGLGDLLSLLLLLL